MMMIMMVAILIIAVHVPYHDERICAIMFSYNNNNTIMLIKSNIARIIIAEHCAGWWKARSG